MRDILPILERWASLEAPFALGTVVERLGSAPRDPGASLAVSAEGGLAGSVTGGCVDPTVIREAKEVLAGAPGRLHRFGLTGEETVGPGLPCGGTIAVAIYALDAGIVVDLAEAVRADRPAALTLRLGEARFGEAQLVFDDTRDASVGSLVAAGESAIVEGEDGELVFVCTIARRPALYVFGISAHASALASLGHFLGYRVTVCDARGAFVTPERFPDADELVVDWPDRFLERAPVDEQTAICVLTHDLKFDVPALVRALGTSARYIGAIGSERTSAEREARLRAEGISDAELARIRAPIGLRIGARSPNEVAVAVGAQLIESNALARTGSQSEVPRATLFS
ncbi:MAG TPA: XdhC family protein [Gaiellaceae bacterium]|nr:XdhC family protein [Gaiellaceae bacterium]